VSWRGGAWTSSPATFAISSRRVDFCVSFRFPHNHELETAADGIIAGIVVDQFLGELREPALGLSFCPREDVAATIAKRRARKGEAE
jgi:hypothetical protein